MFSTSNHNKPVNYPQIDQQWIKESVNTACNLTAETGATKLVKALAGFKGAGGTKAPAFSIVPKRPCLPESFFPPLCVKACVIPLTAVVCVCNGKIQGVGIRGRKILAGRSCRTDVMEKEQTAVY